MAAKGFRCSPEQIQNMRDAQRAADARRGFRHSPETRAKMSVSQKLKAPASDETRLRISESMTGRAFSDSHKVALTVAKTKQFCKYGHDKDISGRTGSLGLLRESVEIFQRLISYLERK